MVEFHGDSGSWEPQLLLCQHFYLVTNAREKAIPLQQVEADFIVTTSGDWIVASVNGNSRNLPESVGKRIKLTTLTKPVADSTARCIMGLCPSCLGRSVSTSLRYLAGFTE